MTQSLAAAEAALKDGRTNEAIGHLVAALTENPAQTAQVYRVLLVQLHRARRFAEGESWSATAVERHPRDYDIWNTRGVFLRQLRRYPEALAALDQAAKLNPRHPAAQANRGNVLLDTDDGVRAEAVFAKLVRLEPRNPEHHRQLGRALAKQGKYESATLRLRQALALRKEFVDPWLDLAGILSEQHRDAEAQDTLVRALAVHPDEPKLLEARAVLLRRTGDLSGAESYLQALLPRFENAAWLHYQIGATVADRDRERGNIHFRRAVELAPEKLDYRMALIESLERTRTGDEGANIQAAYELLKTTLATERIAGPAHLKIASEVLVRVCAFDELAKLGSFKELGRLWAQSGRHTALLKQLARVRSDADRQELIEQHRIWGRSVEAMAAKQPLRRPPRRSAGGKIRLGFMSSDLRNHPVAYFALPLFDHLDRERFEVFCYSFAHTKEDRVQAHIRSKVSGFRWRPEISARDAAQMIAEDQLDMLVELGGSTFMNKLEVMAWRPAPRQASWLGYPHSAGLSAIDHLILDPYILPEDKALLIEQPLVLKNAWYPLAPAIFRDQLALNAEPPVLSNGWVTFGTANNPQKYSREVFETWAQVMRECPTSRFLFIRPEGGARSFREHIVAFFERSGVAADRILFEPVRGAHLPHYNRIDISLDPFPQTGGTTTCESLWMGAPCVTLVGQAPFERLSYSVLTNLGLGDLCARSVAEYVEIATRLAQDPARIAELRAGLRERMRSSPLGRTEAWAQDFYDMIANAVAASPGERSSNTAAPVPAS